MSLSACRGVMGCCATEQWIMVHKKRRQPPKTERPAPQRPAPESDPLELFLASLEQVDPALKGEDEAAAEAPRGTPAKKAKERQGELSIDLHRLTFAAACRRIDEVFGRCLDERGRKFVITVITGKGRHGPGVLAREIHGYVVARYGGHIVEIESSPHETAPAGVPWRGHFKVVLRRTLP